MVRLRRTDAEILTLCFGDEPCDECGWREAQHLIVKGPLGGRTVRCMDPIPKTLTDAAFEAEWTRRISTR